MEVWKDIPGYEGAYQVSNFGRVKSLPKLVGARKTWRTCKGYVQQERILKPQDAGWGYLKVTLWKDGTFKQRKIHRLVLEAFCPTDGMDVLNVNHKDENKKNNHLDNLSWVTPSENVNWGTRNERVSRANSKPVYCVELDKTFANLTTASAETGARLTALCSCLKGKYKTAGGYHWRYAE